MSASSVHVDPLLSPSEAEATLRLAERFGGFPEPVVEGAGTGAAG
jgi:hypothetical protein